MSNTLLIVLGFSIIFLMTTLGSAIIFLFKKEISHKMNSLFLGFAAGIMIAASVWSLLIPSIETAAVTFGAHAWIPAAVGFLLGGGFLVLLDHVLPHLHVGTGQEEGPQSTVRKSVKLFMAVTIHNIPEGLAVGFAFGAAALAGTPAAYLSALGLAIGIGIQNFPEGAAVSLPMQAVVGSKFKAFLFGMGSGAVEPIAAVVGFFLVSQMTFLHPWLLAFAAGAMIFVVAEDLIPDANLSKDTHWGTWGVMAGFVLMMILDTTLG